MQRSRPIIREIRQSHESEDIRIVHDVLRGEVDEFEKLVRKYNTLLYRVGRSYFNDETDVQDAMQTTYLKAFERLNSFGAKASFGHWLSTIMSNECKQMIRRKFRIASLLQHFGRRSGSSSGSLVDDHRTKDRLLHQIEAVITALPSKYRQVAMLRLIQGMSTRETAAILGIGEGNVKARLSRAKNQIRQQWLTSEELRQTFEFHAEKCHPFTARIMDRLHNLAVGM